MVVFGPISFIASTANAAGNFGLDEAAGKGKNFLFSGFGEDIPSIMANVIKSLLSMVGIVFLLLIIYGGVMWMTAGGNEQRIEKAKKILINASVGLAIIILAYSITYFIVESLTLGVEEPLPINTGA